MINLRELEGVNRELEKAKGEILQMRVIWESEEPKIRKDDGSLMSGAIIKKTIRCMIEPMITGMNDEQRIQGLEEHSKYSMLTLKNWNIKLNDKIYYKDNIYKVTHKFLDQYGINYQEYIIQIFTLK